MVRLCCNVFCQCWSVELAWTPGRRARDTHRSKVQMHLAVAYWLLGTKCGGVTRVEDDWYVGHSRLSWVHSVQANRIMIYLWEKITQMPLTRFNCYKQYWPFICFEMHKLFFREFTEAKPNRLASPITTFIYTESSYIWLQDSNITVI